MDAPTPTPPPNNEPAKPSADPEAPRKFIGRFIGIAVMIGAVLLVFWVWNIIERHPRTDDAIALANVIGIAPRVSGPIIKLNVQDNQQVKEGDVLFEIDPADYQLQLDRPVVRLPISPSTFSSPSNSSICEIKASGPSSFETTRSIASPLPE